MLTASDIDRLKSSIDKWGMALVNELQLFREAFVANNMSICESCANNPCNKKAILANIDDAPSIDIVRCKECRWWLKNLTEDDEDEAYLHCPIEDGKPDDFCSYGERSEP